MRSRSRSRSISPPIDNSYPQAQHYIALTRSGHGAVQCTKPSQSAKPVRRFSIKTTGRSPPNAQCPLFDPIRSHRPPFFLITQRDASMNKPHNPDPLCPCNAVPSIPNSPPSPSFFANKLPSSLAPPLPHGLVGRQRSRHVHYPSVTTQSPFLHLPAHSPTHAPLCPPSGNHCTTPPSPPHPPPDFPPYYPSSATPPSSPSASSPSPPIPPPPHHLPLP